MLPHAGGTWRDHRLTVPSPYPASSHTPVFLHGGRLKSCPSDSLMAQSIFTPAGVLLGRGRRALQALPSKASMHGMWPEHTRPAPSRTPHSSCTLAGALLGGGRGALQALPRPPDAPVDSARLRLNRLLNMAGRGGRSSGNSLGALGLFFSVAESGLGYWSDGSVPEELITVAAGGAGACAWGASAVHGRAQPGEVGMGPCQVCCCVRASVRLAWGPGWQEACMFIIVPVQCQALLLHGRLPRL